MNNPYIWPRASYAGVRKIRLGYTLFVGSTESDEYDDEYDEYESPLGNYLVTEAGLRLTTEAGDKIITEGF